MARTKGSKNRKKASNTSLQKKSVKSSNKKKRKYNKKKLKKQKPSICTEIVIPKNGKDEINFHKNPDGTKSLQISFSPQTSNLLKDIFKELKAI